MNVALLAPNLKACCGRSQVVYSLSVLLKSKNINVTVITNKESKVSDLISSNIKVYFVPINSAKYNPFSFLVSCIKLFLYCHLNEIQILHSHHRLAELLCYITKKYHKCKTVITIHSIVDGKKNISYKSDSIISVSNFVKEYTINKFGVRSSVVIYNGIKQPQPFVEKKKQILKILF